MGWANCGEDDLGRQIGYAHEATCDAQGCETKIDRGLSYVCGGMHGGDGFGCGRYFCQEHRTVGEVEGAHSTRRRGAITLCHPCYERLVADGVCDVEEEDVADG